MDKLYLVFYGIGTGFIGTVIVLLLWIRLRIRKKRKHHINK